MDSDEAFLAQILVRSLRRISQRSLDKEIILRGDLFLY